MLCIETIDKLSYVSKSDYIFQNESEPRFGTPVRKYFQENELESETEFLRVNL